MLRALFVEPRIDPNRVVVGAHCHVVTLTGSVGSYSETSLAEGVVENFPSVKAVVDKLAVQGIEQHVYGRSKGECYEDTLARILSALYLDVAIPRERINVLYDNGGYFDGRGRPTLSEKRR